MVDGNGVIDYEVQRSRQIAEWHLDSGISRDNCEQAKPMLPTTKTLGSAGNAATYDKRFDTETSTVFGVGGLPATTEQKLLISEERSNSGKLIGVKAELSWVVPVPGSTTGETRVNRISMVMKRQDFTTLAEFLAMCERAKDILLDTSLMTKVFQGER
jgi:hypothetical protein